MRTIRWRASVALAGLAAFIFLPGSQADTYDSNKSPAVCGAKDRPEPGFQGEVPSGSTAAWNCGVSIVGQLAGMDGPLAMAGDCAYIGSGISGVGVRVIDVRNPAKPKLVNTLPTSQRENLSTVITKDRALLATRHRDTQARQGSNQVVGRDMLVDIWDIHHCMYPKLLGSARFPTENDYFGDFGQQAELDGPVHNVNFSPDGKKVYGTLPLQVADISDLKHPSKWVVKDLECGVAAQHGTIYQGHEDLCNAQHDNKVWQRQIAQNHELDFNKSGSRMYSGSGNPDPPGSDELMVIDMTTPAPTVLGTVKQTPGHSIDNFRVKGKPYLLSSMEVTTPEVSCEPEAVRQSWSITHGDAVFITDISNERALKHVSTYRPAINKFANCSRMQSAGTHYHGVDDASNTTFAMVSWTSAGLRILDLRHPDKPTEAAYFNHGSGAIEPWYNQKTHQIWYIGGGSFWVLTLEPQVRKHLGLKY